MGGGNHDNWTTGKSRDYLQTSEHKIGCPGERLRKGSDILRHRPPFLFIDRFEEKEDGLITHIDDGFWQHCQSIGLANPTLISAEISAQLFGCLCRINAEGPKGAGYLLSLRAIPLWQSDRPTSVFVRHVSSDRFIHRYTAQAMVGTTNILQFDGELAIPEKKPARNVPNNADPNDGPTNTKPFWAADTIKSDSFSSEHRVTFNPLHTIPKGHFPDEPVVPGVVLCEVFTALIMAEKSANPPVNLMLEHVQFSLPISPSDQINVKLRHQENVISVSALNGKKRCARAKFTVIR